MASGENYTGDTRRKIAGNTDQAEQIAQPPANRRAAFRGKGEAPGGALLINELLEFCLHLSRRKTLQSGRMTVDMPN